MMERVLGPLPKHMIVRAEYVCKSFIIFLMIVSIISDVYTQDEAAYEFRLNFHSDYDHSYALQQQQQQQSLSVSNKLE
uniref:Uncharacterized protein n=1 Tax=Arundo donax TaxID=35708 RepID=A0A0A9DJ79_ARUDO